MKTADMAGKSVEAVEETIEISDGKTHGKGLIVKLAGVDTRTDAEQLRGTEFWVSEAELPSLQAGEFYWHQLLGLRVWCRFEDKEILLGQVDHLIETGANDVLVLSPCDGSTDDRERLIPFVEGQVVLSIDREAGDIWVDWHPDD